MIDKIFFGGPVITINSNQPIVEAVGVRGDKIASVGLLDEVKQIMGKECTFINLNGTTLLPGFIDCHLHPVGFINHLVRPDVINIKKINELQEYLKIETIWFK